MRVVVVVDTDDFYLLFTFFAVLFTFYIDTQFWQLFLTALNLIAFIITLAKSLNDFTTIFFLKNWINEKRFYFFKIFFTTNSLNWFSPWENLLWKTCFFFQNEIIQSYRRKSQKHLIFKKKYHFYCVEFDWP